jgi:alpha-D-xyloside xylohydrolase
VERHLRRLIGLGTLGVLAAALTGCGSSVPPQRGISITVAQSPFSYSIEKDGKTVVSETSTRLRYLGTHDNVYTLTNVTSSSGNLYHVATSEPGRTATVKITREPDGYDVDVRLHPQTHVTEIYDSFTVSADDHFVGAGERGGTPDLLGDVLPIAVSYQCAYAPVPFFASTGGWGLRLASLNVGGFGFPLSLGGPGCQATSVPPCAFPPLDEIVEVCLKGARLDEDVYLGTIPEVLHAYQADAGEPKVPPPSELELVKWRDVVNSPADVIDDITRLQAAKIPLGTVLLDNPWETCVGSLTFDRTRIPNPAALIRQVHAMGVQFMLWVSPKNNCYPSGYPPGGLLGPPGYQVLNLTHPAVVKEFQSRLRKVFALGVDGVKGDRGDEVDLQSLSESLQNTYPQLYARDVLAVLKPGGPTIFRAAVMGSQTILPGLWAGDEPATFGGLQTAIYMGESAAMSGFPTWGSDIGGYNAVPPPETAELFARWAQFGALSPVMEVGGEGQNATPWELGPVAMDALRAAAVLHYELFPYLYGLLQAHEPVLRPLGYAYPDDPRSWAASNELEFLVGPDLLAAPVIGPGTTPSVFLPDGNWIDLYTGGAVEGGEVFTRTTSLTEFPFYIHANAVVPFNLRTTRDSWWGLNELTHPGRAGYLATPGATLDLHRLPHDVQLFVPYPGPPKSVTIGGRRVAWTWTAKPFPGAVIRLHGPTIAGLVDVQPL